MKHGSKQLIISALIIVAGFAVVFFLSGFIESVRPALPRSYEDENLALEGKKLKGYALGAEGLLADWYWMRSLQYIGDKLMKTDAEYIDLNDLRFMNPRLLYPMLDNATDLDPKFIAAYSYGANVLPAINPSQAVALTEKGIANNPYNWRLYQYLGYIHWRIKEYDKAAEVYEQGAKIDGAPEFMRQMVAVMRTQGGDRSTARTIYLQMVEEARDQSSKESAKLRLMQLDSLDEIDAINEALDRFKRQTGRCAGSFAEILPLLKTVTLPGEKDFRVDSTGNLVDPTEAPYALDQSNCRASLGPDSRIPGA